MQRFRESLVPQVPKRPVFPERRRAKRFRLLCRAFAVANLHFGVLGQIMDISRDGLGVRYVAARQRTREVSVINIMLLLAEHGFSYNHLPVKSVWDRRIPRDYPCTLLCARRCGMQFRPMTKSQIAELQHFIEHYTTGQIMALDEGG
ncbi:MAG: PilZ domain-containing protein [Deltaproteobacteria bacterium]|nr:PilZ domain-containing protein [Deltaproteobacteria bacterium]